METSMSRHHEVAAYFERMRISDILEALLCELGDKCPDDPYSCIEEWAARKRRERKLDTQSFDERPESKFASSLLLCHHWRALVTGDDVVRSAFTDAFRDCCRRRVKSNQRCMERENPFAILAGGPAPPQPLEVLACDVGLPLRDGGDMLWILSEGNSKEHVELCDLQRLSLVDVVICCVSTGSEEECAALQKGVCRVAPMCGVRGLVFWSAFLLSGSARARIEMSVVPYDPDTGAKLDVAFVDGSVQRVLESQWHRVPREMARSKTVPASVDVGSLPLRCIVLCCYGCNLTCGEQLTAIYSGASIPVLLVSIDLVFTDRNPSNVVRPLPTHAGGQMGAVLTLATRTAAESLSTVRISDAAVLDREVLTLVRVDSLHASVDAVFKAHWTRCSPDEQADEGTGTV